MRNILEFINNLLNKKEMDLNDFKQALLKEYNNLQLIDIIIKKGQTEKNIEISKQKIKLIKKFEFESSSSEISICFSIPPFEKVALETILRTKRVSFMTIEDCFKHLIRKSKKIIKISSPFFERTGWTRLESEFLEFLKKGGKIIILCRGKELNQDGETLGSKRRKQDVFRIINMLKVNNISDQIEFREYHYSEKRIRSSTHAKLFISDNKEAYIGSGELRKNSFDVNFEMGVLLKGNLVKDIENVFDFMVDTSRKIV
jgi:hypothetical protein